MELEKRLSRISWRLAYAFRAYLLEEKIFDERISIAKSMEQKFLETYFGTNLKILDFARELISRGHKPAARALNEAIQVLGGRADAERIIQTIRSDFQELSQELLSMAQRLRSLGLEEEAVVIQLTDRGLTLGQAQNLAKSVFST